MIPALRDYQLSAVDQLRENMAKGLKNQVLCAPTGSGKTVIAAHLIEQAFRKGKRSMFVVDRISLVAQTSAVLDAAELPHGIIQAQHPRYRPSALIQIASAQTLERRGWPDPLDLVIVDECHSWRKETANRLRSRFCFAIGLTATPFTPGLGRLYDGIVSVTTTDQLISDGMLCPFTVYSPSPIDMDGAQVVAGEWTDSAAEERGLRVVGDVVENYVRLAEGRKFIAFGATIRHCEAIHQQMMEAGIRTELYTSRTPDSEREHILEEYRKPDSSIRGLISVAALSKGFDVPSVSCLIIARPLKSSFAEHIQIIGRGLRADPEDPDKRCIILDHAENCMRFGPEMADFFANSVQELPDDDPARKAKKLDPEERWKKCPKCMHVHTPKPFCPSCGFEYPHKVIIHDPGSLDTVSISSADMSERRQWFSGLRWIQQQRGYKDGWVGWKFKEKFGSWPPRSFAQEPATPPTAEVRKYVISRNIARAKGKAKAGA
jgi:DNA repair protein RadD